MRAEAPMYPRLSRRGARIPDEDGTDAHKLNADSQIVIVAMLPNPPGSEETGRETIIIGNQGSAPRSLDGRSLADDDGESMSLGDTVLAAGGCVTIRLDGLRLGNSGDEVRLLGDNGDVAHELHYKNTENGRFDVP